MFMGTSIYFEITPYTGRVAHLNLLGSDRDIERVWHIVEVIKTVNPDAQLLKY
jgi:hypothetical protein